MKTQLYGVKVEMEPTGSRYICNPPVLDTDEDWVVFVTPQNFDELWEAMLEDEFELGGSDIPQPAESDEILFCHGHFNSFKKGDINYIITTDKEFFDNFGRATAIAKRLNLANKEDRIMLFQIFLYDNWEGVYDL